AFRSSNSKPPNLLYFGRLKRYKRVDHVIRSFEIVHRKIPDSRLTIAGKGDDEDRLRKMAAELVPDGAIDFVGFIDEPGKLEYLTGSKLYVIASEKEGWGISVIESNAAGVPAVGYDVE